MTTMEKLDAMMKDAEQRQEQEVDSLKLDETFAIEGVQLNEASRPVTIYHRETGEPRTLPKLAAGIALHKRYRNPGHPNFRQFIFSATPTVEFHLGKVKCLLVPDNPRRTQFDVWGLPVCESAHLASPAAMRRHMELRHPSAWRVIKEEDLEQRRQQELEAQKALAQSVLQAMQQIGGQDGAKKSKKSKKPSPASTG